MTERIFILDKVLNAVNPLIKIEFIHLFITSKPLDQQLKINKYVVVVYRRLYALLRLIGEEPV